MRVIAGEAKGRTLAEVKGGGTRSATDRVRETLFAILEPRLEGARVLDLFAGAGTLGIEALSRGAARAVFVERAAEAVRTLRRNVAAVGFADRAVVVSAEVCAYLDGVSDGFDLAFCDAPFPDTAGLEATLAHPRLAAALGGAGLAVARYHRKHAPRLPAHGRIVREKALGEEALIFVAFDPPMYDAR